ncbi:NFACT family protein [uncultured Desulfuromusa sp.]|uniref:Rqc2 family fibronectin-binding protein n=1 Tax=uncultured Desulfuromusa sp. TaxID=219183 RepID=UPI002AA899DD|nr:NFACT family protein [uncultured Desulfuromusa sp.]
MKLELIRKVVSELSVSLMGARISKIYQPSPEMLLIKLWTGRETLRLLVSVGGQNSRLHLTEQTWPNPHIPPRFCQLLRARVSRVDSIAVVNDDRIVKLDCWGRQGDCHLYIELTGNRGNLILVDDQGVIIDVLKRITDDSGKRVLLAGERYLLPEKNNFNLREGSALPTLPDGSCSWNQTVDKLYSQSQCSDNKNDFRKQLQQAVARQIKKLQKRQLSIERDALKQKDYDAERIRAELLLANLHSLRRGMTEIVLQNYYQQPAKEQQILLDPLLTPQENAEKYFQRFKKGKRGQEHSRRRLEETQAELEWLQQLEYQLQDTVKNSDIEEIATELREVGILKDRNRLHSKRTLQPSKPHEATCPSGFKILWGRNNRQNDEISTKMLKNGDFWFHVYNAPGAHVVLKAGQLNTELLDADLYYAASLAAGYSKSKDDDKVTVMFAEAKAVHKPKGGKPGLVNVLQYKTIVVKPFRID